MTITKRFLLLSSIAYAGFGMGAAPAETPGAYRGTPFHDSVYMGRPQSIPGRVQCAYFDLGGEGVAYHNTESKNKGSGALNPANGSYLNEFRMNEAVGISYAKFHDAIDDNPFENVKPVEGQLYVGWTNPGEWFNMTVRVAHRGVYEIDLLYTSNRGGKIALDLDGSSLVSAFDVLSTWNAAETIPWRQWHHWNLMKKFAVVSLPEGVSVLTVHIVSEGNMNLAYFEFRPSQ